MTSDAHVSEYLPAYVLDCLDEEEILFVSEHLAGCAVCREALREYQRTVDLLALAVEAAEPAPHLKYDLLEHVCGGVPRGEEPRGAAGWWQRRVAALRSTQLAWAAGLAALLLVISLVGLAVWGLGRANERVQVGDMSALPMEATAAAPGASGALVMDPRGRFGTIVVDSLPELDEEQAYQVWLIQDGRRESETVFRLDRWDYGAVLLWPEEPLISYAGVEVTLEPAGGSTSPTGPVLLAASIR